MGRYSRGFTLIEAVVAMAIAALVVGIPLTVMSAQGHGFARDSARAMHATALDGLVTQLQMSAHTAVSIYTPRTCGSGTGDGTSCSSIRFYGVDSSGAPHYWGWDYDAASKLVTQCESYASSEGNCTSTGAAVSVTEFTAKPTAVTTIAAAYGVSAPSPVEKNVLSSDTRVVAGNRVMVVNIGDAWATRTTHLLQEGAPFSAAVVKGAFTPPNLGSLGTTLGGTTLIFTTPSSANQSIIATETNYGQYLPYVSTPWTVSSCTSGGTAIANPSLTSYSGDAATIAVRPNAAGTCSFTITTKDQTTTVNVIVYPAPVYRLAIAAGPNPSWVYVGNSSTFSATNALQNSSAVRPATWPSSYSVSVSASGPCSNLGPYGWQGSGTTFTVRLTGAGTCDATVSGNAPAPAVQQNAPLTVSIPGYNTPVYTLNVTGPSPTQITATQTTASLTATATQTQPQTPPGTAASVPVGITASTGPCSFTPTGWRNSGQNFTLSGTNAGTCTFTVCDTTSGVSNANAQQCQTASLTVIDPTCANGAANWPACTTPTPGGGVTITKVFAHRYTVYCADAVSTACYGYYTDGKEITDSQSQNTVSEFGLDFVGYVMTVSGSGQQWVKLTYSGVSAVEDYNGVGSAAGRTITPGAYYLYNVSTQTPRISTFQFYDVKSLATLETISSLMAADNYRCQMETTSAGAQEFSAWADGRGIYCQSNVSNPTNPVGTGVQSRFLNYWYNTAPWSTFTLMNVYYDELASIDAQGNFVENLYLHVNPGQYFLWGNTGQSQFYSLYSPIGYGVNQNNMMEFHWWGAYGGSFAPDTDVGNSTNYVDMQEGIISFGDFSATTVPSAPTTPSPAPTATPCVGGKVVCGGGPPGPPGKQIVPGSRSLVIPNPVPRRTP